VYVLIGPHVCTPEMCQFSSRYAIFWVIDRPGSYIGSTMDQLLILIYIARNGAYITAAYSTPGKRVSVGSAIFCAAGQPAFISDGVTYVAWSPLSNPDPVFEVIA